LLIWFGHNFTVLKLNGSILSTWRGCANSKAGNLFLLFVIINAN